jgi:N-carbamoyl-L-amino-acid hydrolase
MAEAEQKARVRAEVVDEWVYGSEAFDPDCVGLVRAAARRLGIPHRDILSKAGHDAFNMARYCPTAMIFCPCKDGITHNEAEDCTIEDTVPSVDDQLHAVLARAER